jgi:hypothetical protein
MRGTRSGIARASGGRVARNSTWNGVRTAETAGSARELSAD